MIIRIFLFVLFSQCLLGQSVSEKFDDYQSSHHLEKIYINHDKPFYLLGDTIWCQAVFVDGRTHQFFDASPIVHVDLLNDDGEILKNYLLKIDQGLASFEIPTSYSDEAGNYLLRAYTQYQRNFSQAYLFQKSITVFSDSLDYKSENLDDQAKDIVVQFFPEGGELVRGLNNKVAVKVQSVEGDNLDYSGVLVDQSGNEIKTFKSYNEGIGVIEFTPKQNEVYSAKIMYDGFVKKVALPAILDDGYTINVNGRSKDHLVVTISSNTKKQLDGATLLGHVRGQLFFDQKFGSESSQQLKLPRGQIPSGILHFTLFDNKNRPVCERLAFNKNPDESVNVGIEMERSNYGQREKITLDVQPTQGNKIIPSSLSVSVYNEDVIPRGDNDLSIVNYLLLQSDLVGRVDNVNQYFIADDTKSNFLIDLLMLTQGWRRFTWQDVKDNNLPQMEFATAEDIPLIGVVRKHNKDETVKADVFLSVLSKSDFTSTNITTDEDGIFYFKGMEFSDTTDVLIQANIHDGKKKKKLKKGEAKRTGNDNVDIEILKLDDLVYDPTTTIKNQVDQDVIISELAKEFKEIKRIDYLYHPEWSIDLEEVTIKGIRKTKEEVKLKTLETEMKSRGMFYTPSSQKIFVDDLPGGGSIYQNIFQMVRGRVPGVRINGGNFILRETANIKDGEIPATVMLDGFEIRAEMVENIDVQNVMVIDVIKGLSATSIYGERGAGGIINVITKNPGEMSKSDGTKQRVKGSLNIQLPGIYNAREFYSLDYSKKSISHQQPNLKTTLYWEPMIRIGKKLKQLSFYTGDKGGSYLVKVEGITDSGFPFIHYEKFVVAYQ